MVEIEDFQTGWYGIKIGLKTEDIESLIAALNQLKIQKTHFHIRSDFAGDGGVGDVGVYFHENEIESNMEIEASVEPKRI